MQEYKRYGLVLQTLEGRMLACPLPLRLASDPAPTIFDVRDVLIPDQETETGYIVNYTGYYVVCPSCMDRVLAEPPESAPAESPVVARGDEGEELGRSPAGFTFDLAPCPQCQTPAHGLSVLVRSEDQGAQFLHPTRLYPSELESQVRVAEFGTIKMQEFRAADYQWKPILKSVEEAEIKGMKKLIRKVRARGSMWQRYFLDENGEFDVGPLDPPNDEQRRKERREFEQKHLGDSHEPIRTTTSAKSNIIIPLHELDVELDDI